MNSQIIGDRYRFPAMRRAAGVLTALRDRQLFDLPLAPPQISKGRAAPAISNSGGASRRSASVRLPAAQQHEIAMVGDILQNLIIAVARVGRCRTIGRRSRQIGAGIVDGLILADQAAQFLADLPGPRSAPDASISPGSTAKAGAAEEQSREGKPCHAAPEGVFIWMSAIPQRSGRHLAAPAGLARAAMQRRSVRDQSADHHRHRAAPSGRQRIVIIRTAWPFPLHRRSTRKIAGSRRTDRGLARLLVLHGIKTPLRI
jgi:hypothetical protein